MHRHLNELRAKAVAGDTMAAKALEAAMFVPHHLRRIGTPIDRYMKRQGVRFSRGLHVTAKTHKGIRCLVADTISQDYGLDRLQMLKERHA